MIGMQNMKKLDDSDADPDKVDGNYIKVQLPEDRFGLRHGPGFDNHDAVGAECDRDR
ncbi:MAG: hypothetical protein ACE5EX_00085 [Phycisphaerae bacterium]